MIGYKTIGQIIATGNISEISGITGMFGAVNTSPVTRQIATSPPVMTMFIASEPVQYPCSFSNLSEHLGQLTRGLKYFVCVFLLPQRGQALVTPRQTNIAREVGKSYVIEQSSF